MKKILFILLLTLPLSVQGKIYAVLVGISEYEQSVSDLTYSHQDAIEMHEMLKEHTSPDNMKLLTNDQATLDNIVYYTKQLFLQAQPEDIVIFFFSGHGVNNIFLTYDKSLYFYMLKDILKETNAKRRFIFADACHSGTFRQPDNQEASSSPDMGNNVLVFLSSRSGQYSIESRFLKNGTFTYFLLAGLKGGADRNKDGYITAKELFNFVYPKVKERSNGRQIPVMWGKFNKNMIILKLKDK
jgi:uncharacterized caspase-like protein